MGPSATSKPVVATEQVKDTRVVPETVPVADWYRITTKSGGNFLAPDKVTSEHLYTVNTTVYRVKNSAKFIKLVKDALEGGGMQPGDSVALYSRKRGRLLARAEVAAFEGGGKVADVNSREGRRANGAQLRDAGSRFAVVERQSDLDRLLKLVKNGHAPKLEKIIALGKDLKVPARDSARVVTIDAAMELEKSARPIIRPRRASERAPALDTRREVPFEELSLPSWRRAIDKVAPSALPQDKKREQSADTVRAGRAGHVLRDRAERTRRDAESPAREQRSRPRLELLEARRNQEDRRERQPAGQQRGSPHEIAHPEATRIARRERAEMTAARTERRDRTPEIVRALSEREAIAPSRTSIRSPLELITGQAVRATRNPQDTTRPNLLQAIAQRDEKGARPQREALRIRDEGGRATSRERGARPERGAPASGRGDYLNAVERIKAEVNAPTGRHWLAAPAGDQTNGRYVPREAKALETEAANVPDRQSTRAAHTVAPRREASQEVVSEQLESGQVAHDSDSHSWLAVSVPRESLRGLDVPEREIARTAGNSASRRSDTEEARDTGLETSDSETEWSHALVMPALERIVGPRVSSEPRPYAGPQLERTAETKPGEARQEGASWINETIPLHRGITTLVARPAAVSISLEDLVSSIFTPNAARNLPSSPIIELTGIQEARPHRNPQALQIASDELSVLSAGRILRPGNASVALAV